MDFYLSHNKTYSFIVYSASTIAFQIIHYSPFDRIKKKQKNNKKQPKKKKKQQQKKPTRANALVQCN